MHSGGPTLNRTETKKAAVAKRPRLSKDTDGVLVMTQRADFVAASRADRQSSRSVVVQMRDRKDPDGPVRVGFTCSKKVGNAVARNRAKRRLRALARTILPNQALPGRDYVLIGRGGVTGTCPWSVLQDDLRRALKRLHGQ